MEEGIPNNDIYKEGISYHFPLQHCFGHALILICHTSFLNISPNFILLICDYGKTALRLVQGGRPLRSLS